LGGRRLFTCAWSASTRLFAYRSTWCHAAGHISSRTRGDTVGGAASDQPKRRVSWKTDDSRSSPRSCRVHYRRRRTPEGDDRERRYPPTEGTAVSNSRACPGLTTPPRSTAGSASNHAPSAAVPVAGRPVGVTLRADHFVPHMGTWRARSLGLVGRPRPHVPVSPAEGSWFRCGAARRSRLGLRFDVLIDAEEVAWVVVRLDPR